MLVSVSRKTDKRHRIYHRLGCIYAKRIKPDNKIELSAEQARRRNYHECKYCAGLAGDVKVHKDSLATWEWKHKMQFAYQKTTDTFYIQTEVGFWKIFVKEDFGKYLLYHRNTFSKEMNFRQAINGDFHRQKDVVPTESMEKIVEYIIAHDRAKLIIMDDYRKLPRTTRRQKKYYKAAERKAKKRELYRVNFLFAELEASREG